MPVAIGLVLLLRLAPSQAAPPNPNKQLAQAIALFESFHDAEAATLFREVLRHSPPRLVAGKAHLYLGLNAINRLDTDRAIEEFKAALMIEPTLDFIRGASPKGRLAFEEARHALEGQLRRPEAEAAAAAPPPATHPSSDTEGALDPYAEEKAAPPTPGRSHALAIALGAVGIVAAGVGIYGGVDVLEYDNAVSGTRGFKTTPFTQQLQSSQSQASFWAVAWIPFVVAGALGLGAGAFTW